MTLYLRMLMFPAPAVALITSGEDGLVGTAMTEPPAGALAAMR